MGSNDKIVPLERAHLLKFDVGFVELKEYKVEPNGLNRMEEASKKPPLDILRRDKTLFD